MLNSSEKKKKKKNQAKSHLKLETMSLNSQPPISTLGLYVLLWEMLTFGSSLKIHKQINFVFLGQKIVSEVP